MKARKVLGIIAGVIAALYGILYIAFYERTLPIEGLIVDSKTGEPVSKVFVKAYWHFSVPNLVDTTGANEGHGTVTDGAGRFRIPARNVTRVMSSFVDLNLHIQHPLYDFERVQIYVKRKYRLGDAKEGVLRLTKPIVSYEDKYVRFEDRIHLATAIGYCRPDFFVAMKQHYNVRYDIPSIMHTLERLSKRFPEEGRQPSETEQAFSTTKYFMSQLPADY